MRHHSGRPVTGTDNSYPSDPGAPPQPLHCVPLLAIDLADEPRRVFRLEKLRGDREGQHSIRINQQWWICFSWSEAGPEDVEIVDYH